MPNRTDTVFFDVGIPHKKEHYPRLLFLLNLLHRKKHRLFVSVAAVLTILGIFGAHTLFANVRTLSAAACSGDFEDASALIEEGGARATASGQKLFCSFAAPSLANPVALRRATLSVSFGAPSSPDPAQPSGAVQEEEAESPEISNSKTENAVETPAEEVENPSEAPQEESAAESSEEPALEQVQEEAPEPPAEEPDASAEPPPAEEVSWFRFSTIAHAQEEELLPEPEQPQDLPETDEDESEPAPEEPISEEFPVTQEEVEVVEAEPAARSLLTLSYTTDGVHWTDLTTFTPQENEVTFDLMVASSDELARLVVRLTADTVVEEIIVRDIEMRIETEGAFEEGGPIGEAPLGSHTYTRQFSVDPDATHSCALTPLTVRMSHVDSAAATLSLFYGDDVRAGVRGAVAQTSEALLEVLDREEAVDDTDSQQEVLEEKVPSQEAATTTEAVIEEAYATSTEEVAPEEAGATSTEAEAVEPAPIEDDPHLVSMEERSILEKLLGAVLDPVIESSIDTLEELSRVKVGLLEIGSLPSGIDVRFATGTSAYAQEIYDDLQPQAELVVSVYGRETAQTGSFSVPIIFTRSTDAQSTVVCQLNIINRPDDPLPEPEPEEEPATLEEPQP